MIVLTFAAVPMLDAASTVTVLCTGAGAADITVGCEIDPTKPLLTTVPVPPTQAAVIAHTRDRCISHKVESFRLAGLVLNLERRSSPLS